jgi:hypothetical protein
VTRTRAGGNAARIRWEDEPPGYAVAIDGFTGPSAWNWRTFRIWHPDPRVDPRPFLTSDLPGQARKQQHGTMEELKAEAERWLEEFVSSLGAVFPKAAEAAER